jgi:hypothetical protein
MHITPVALPYFFGCEPCMLFRRIFGAEHEALDRLASTGAAFSSSLSTGPGAPPGSD